MSEQTSVVNLSQAPALEQPAPVQNQTTQATEPKPDPLAPKFAALAKKERQARLLAQQVKFKEQALAKRAAEIEAKEREWNEEFKLSPLAALKKRNLTYEDITKAALNDDKFQPEVAIKDVKADLQRLREENAQKEKDSIEMAKKRALQAEQEAIQNFQEQIGSHIIGNKDKYELTSLYEANDLVFQTVEEHFNRTKKILSIPEACELVEQYLESELERTSKESKKFQSKFLGSKQNEEPRITGKTSTTLSNGLNSSAAPSMLPQKTEDDRLKRALAKLG